MAKGAELVALSRDELEAWLAGNDLPELEDSIEYQLSVANRVLQAGTVDDALKQETTISADDILGVPLTILGVEWRRSTQAGNAGGRYAIMRCVDGAGEERLVTTGGFQVVIALRKMEVENWFPVTVTIERAAKPSASGGFAKWLAPVAESF